MASSIATLVVFDGLVAGAPAGDAGLDALVGQSLAEPVGVIASVREQPVRFGQGTQERQRAGVVADLSRAQEEAERPPVPVGDRMELGVEPAFRAADEPPALRRWPPFFDRRLEAVRCALR